MRPATKPLTPRRPPRSAAIPSLRIEHENLECVSRRGICVKRFSKPEMARLFEAREALPAGLAASRIDPAGAEASPAE